MQIPRVLPSPQARSLSFIHKLHGALVELSASLAFIRPFFPASRSQPCCTALSDPKGVGHDRQRWIHGATRGEETPVDDVKIVEIVGFAVRIERGGAGVIAKPDCSVLVRDTREGDALADEQIPGEQTLVTLVSMNGAFGLLFHEALDSIDQARVTLFVVRFVSENDVALSI